MKRILTVGICFAFAFSARAIIIIENYGSSSANTGGNSARGGTVKTGNASASVSIKTETGGSAATTTVHATAKANDEKKEASEVFTGSGEVSVEVSARASSTNATTTVDVKQNDEFLEEEHIDSEDEQVEIKNITVSRITREEKIRKESHEIAGNILSAIKKIFVYVISIFRI